MMNKPIFGLGQLPIILIGMITHGHGDERYVQYSNGYGQMIPIS
jgi:hypothetical protein